jgi:hypothetical protein
MSGKKSPKVPTPADPLAPIETHLSSIRASLESTLHGILLSLLTRLEPAAIAVTAGVINGSKPFPTDPKERAALISQASLLMHEARQYNDEARKDAEILGAEAATLIERGIDVWGENELDARTPSWTPSPMSFEAFVNRVAGSKATGANMARVRKWLAWRDPAADIPAEMDKLRKAAGSYLAEHLADGFAVSFKKWQAETLTATNRAKGKAAAAKRKAAKEAKAKALDAIKRRKK